MKRIAWFTTIILATLVVFLLFWQFREALLLFFLSLGMGAAARPTVDRLTRRKLPRGLGLILVYFGALLVVGVLLALVSGSLIAEIESLSNRFALFYEQIWSAWPSGTQIQQTISHNLPPPNDLYKAIAGSQGEIIVQTVLGITLSSVTMISQLLAVLVLSIYWTVDQVHFERLWLSLLPVDQRAQAREIWRDIEAGVGAYIRSELIQSLLAGILLGLGLWIIGVPYPILLGIFGAVVWLIPWLGAVLVVLPVAWVGLWINPGVAVTGAIYTITVLLFLEIVVEPRIYNRAQYSSLLTIILVIALADVLGVFGILLAPPLAAAVQILYKHLISAQISVPEVETPDEFSDLQARVDEVRELALSRGEEPPPQTINLLDRLDSLLHETKKAISR